MDSQKTIAEKIESTLCKHKETVTTLSKTDENYFIKNPTLMYDWDTLTELNTEDVHQSVDAIYLHVENEDVRLYFFEFKQLDLKDKFFDARKQLKDSITNMEQCIWCCGYPNELKKIRKKLVSKKVISLKTKPLESLILLHNLLNKNGISSEDIINIKKEYYVVSLTQISTNKTNSHRKIKQKGIFEFMNKIVPFPFEKSEPMTPKTFITTITKLEEKQNLQNNS